MVKLILLHDTLFFCMAWGVLEEKMDKLDFVLLSSVKMVTRLMLRVWGSEYNQKMAFQIEVKSC